MSCHEKPCVRCRRPAREGRDGVNVFDDGCRVFAGPLCRCCLADLLRWLEPCERTADPGCGKDCAWCEPGNPDPKCPLKKPEPPCRRRYDACKADGCEWCRPRNKPEPCPTPGIRPLVIPVRVEVPECEREKLKAIRTLLGG